MFCILVFLAQLLLFLQLLFSMIYCFLCVIPSETLLKVSLYILCKAVLCPLQFCLLDCMCVCASVHVHVCA